MDSNQILSTVLTPGMIHTVIISYGIGHHDDPPGTALRIDTRTLRNPPDDPTVRERMLHSNGLDPEVRDYVLNTMGAMEIVERAVDQTAALLLADSMPGGDPHLRTDVHVACGGGRHRSVAIAEELGAQLRGLGVGVEVEHRHIGREILPH
jgi:RNase adaptor protein for sRNA GlmZ degradation